MSGAEKMEYIEVNHASVNNLKDISVSFPLNAFSCVTGVSGCGKSSLVYDTIYAESQRNLLESMSGNMYGQKLMNKPDVQNIKNLRPALDIAQNYYNSNPRSTVGTITDISYYVRTLFAFLNNVEHKTAYTEGFFSSNNPNSCCKYCHGLGEEYAISMNELIPDSTKTLAQGAILYYQGNPTSLEYKILNSVCDLYGININGRYCDLTDWEKNTLLYREKTDLFHISFKSPSGKPRHKDIKSRGAVVELNEKLLDIDTPSTYLAIKKYLKKQECAHCGGSKLKEEVLAVKICEKNIADVESLKIDVLESWLKDIRKRYSKKKFYENAEPLVEEIEKRIKKLVDLKVEYLNLSRPVPSLSGGEIQRIRIATQLTCSLCGLIYILDEPCKGLHLRDIDVIVNATRQLVQDNNTVIAIEHNKKYIYCADKVVELGPVGGPDGGYIVSEYKPKNRCVYKPKFRKAYFPHKFIEFMGVTFHNLNKQNASIPVKCITCVTGVSGSGKSSLVKAIAESLSSKSNYCCEKVTGGELIKHVEMVNQKPIGKTPRSTVISYLDIFDLVRNIFASTTEAKDLGLTPADFSMNVKGGRCEECQGTGTKKIELTYLPETFVICPVCGGQRFKKIILSVHYKGYSINDILNSTIDVIADVFKDNEEIYSKLLCMVKIGLGYIKLGQMSMNLSGGEAQRIKLARALGTVNKNGNLYVLDEPTSGLNDKDISRFESIINELKNQGNTILVIEHNVEFVVNNADYVIDFGCYGGDKGGKIVAQGDVKKVFENIASSWSFLFQ